MKTVFTRSQLKRAALGGAIALAAIGLAVACVDRVEPCEKFDVFAEAYRASCPEADDFASQCATEMAKLEPAPRQSFDWCVDCYTMKVDDTELDCSVDPLEVSCATMLTFAIGGTCTADSTP